MTREAALAFCRREIQRGKMSITPSTITSSSIKPSDMAVDPKEVHALPEEFRMADITKAFRFHNHEAARYWLRRRIAAGLIYRSGSIGIAPRVGAPVALYRWTALARE